MTDMMQTDRTGHDGGVGNVDDQGKHMTHANADPAPTRTQRRSRRRWWMLGLGLVVAVAVVAVALSGSNGSGEVITIDDRSTMAVVRTDLVVAESLDGTLGYGTADPIVFKAGTDGVESISVQASGTVTAVVEAGATVGFGDMLVEIDGAPVVVLEGDIPAYRSFNSRTSDGDDVAQLEQALFDLGYDPDGDMTIDEDMTSATIDAIELMQETLGYEATGSLALGDVVFASSPLYIAEVNVGVGDSINPGTSVVATSTTLSGTATALPDEGSTLGLGDTVVAIDGEPVALLIGDIPLYRALDIGLDGPDVEQLQTNLVQLGFLAPDDYQVGTFDAVTSAGLVAWQASIGATPDGVVNIGDVVYSGGAIRVQETLVVVGDAVTNGTSIMTTSINETFVSVQLSTDDQDLVEVGDTVTVELPSGAEEPAIVTEIGSVVLATQQGATYFEMTVTLDDPDAAAGLDEAPVDVLVIGDRADDVTAVPVTALLALAEGGYAVETVQSDGTTVLVGVTTGLFADGYVEVMGAISEGMEVVVP